MPRIVFQKGFQRKFLERVRTETGLPFAAIAKRCGGHPRSYSDWLREKTTLPKATALKLSRLARAPLPRDILVKGDFWYTRKAGRLGGLAHSKKYGNPGTPAGRSLGGLRSLLVHKRRNTKFKRRKIVRGPTKNSELAELCGILLGDGNISYHQVSITLNRETDAEYGQWIMRLMKRLFAIEVTTRHVDHTTSLVLTGVNAVECLLKYGLKRGNKIRQQVDIPLWIKGRPSYAKACARGLIDTDGCVYIDQHRYGRKTYKNICLAFTSYSKPLLESVYNLFLSLNIKSRLYRNNVKIRKEMDVYRYYQLIGSHNEKHLAKLKEFFQRGEVA